MGANTSKRKRGQYVRSGVVGCHGVGLVDFRLTGIIEDWSDFVGALRALKTKEEEWDNFEPDFERYRSIKRIG